MIRCHDFDASIFSDRTSCVNQFTVKDVYKRQVITSLKTVFEISEIAKTLEILRTDAESQKSYYNDFVACMNGQFPQEAPQVILSACQTLQCYRATHQLLNDLEGGNNV